MRNIRGYGAAVGLSGEDVTKAIPASINGRNKRAPHSHTMVLRKGRFGVFYGCTGYPACRYKEKLESSKPGCSDMNVLNRDKTLLAKSS